MPFVFVGTRTDPPDPPDPPAGFHIEDPPYLPLIPGVSGPGFDSPAGSGRHLSTPRTNVFFIDTKADGNYGDAAPSNWGIAGRTFVGTSEWARRHNAVGKIYVYMESGWIRADPPKSHPTQTGTPPRDGYVTDAGQTAPFPGVWFRGVKVTGNGASHVHLWHVRAGMGDDPGGLAGNNRRCFESGYDGGAVSHFVLSHCEGFFSGDEIQTFFQRHVESSVYACAFYDPLHISAILHPGDPPGTDHGFMAMMGGAVGGQCDFVMYKNNLLANGTARAPWVVAEKLIHVNNVTFNSGRPGGGNGNGLQIRGQNATQPTFANVLGNVAIRGPENTNSPVSAHANSDLVAGSRCHSADNMLIGWPLASQNDFFQSAPASFLQSTRVAVAYPADWTDASVKKWAVNPLAPTLEEKQAMLALMKATVGAQPGWRTPQYGGRLNNVFAAMEAVINGVNIGPQFINTVPVGGWHAMPTRRIEDPNNPGPDWHAPFPTGPDRDDYVPWNDTWGNQPWIPAAFRGNAFQLIRGSDRRTNVEKWLILQHWYVMNSSTRPNI